MIGYYITYLEDGLAGASPPHPPLPNGNHRFPTGTWNSVPLGKAESPSRFGYSLPYTCANTGLDVAATMALGPKRRQTTGVAKMAAMCLVVWCGNSFTEPQGIVINDLAEFQSRF